MATDDNGQGYMPVADVDEALPEGVKNYLRVKVLNKASSDLTQQQIDWINYNLTDVAVYTANTTDATPTLIHSVTIAPEAPKTFKADFRCFRDDGTQFYRQQMDVLAENVLNGGVYMDWHNTSIQNPDNNPEIIGTVVVNGNDVEFYVIGVAAENYGWALGLETGDF